MQTLINDARDRINSLNVFRYIDEDWGQLDEYNPNPPVKWPAALVDLIAATPGNIGNKQQLNDVTLRVRVADIRLSNSSQEAPEGQRTAATSALKYAQMVFASLHGWHKAGSTYSTLQRVRLQRVPRGDGIREYAVDFVCQVADTGAAQVVTDLSYHVPHTIAPDVGVVRSSS